MEPLIIFTHIPKTAGSTITSVTDALFRPHEQAKIYSDSDRPAFMAALSPRVRFLTGHAVYGLHQYTPRPCRYFTILRDPVERVVSLYYYLRRATDHASHRRILAGEETLLDVVNSQRDVQTDFIAGLKAGDSRPAAEKLALARENLVRAYEVTGLAERFDESLLLLEAAFQWRIRTYRQQNVTRHRPAWQSVLEEVRAALEDNNRLDQQLYDFAAQRFQAQIDAAPAGFGQRLEQLRARTVRMGKVHALSERAHRWVKRWSGRG